MNRFILQLASMKEIALAPPDGDPRTNRYTAGQRLVVDETQRLLTAFLKQEKKASEDQSAFNEALHARMKRLLEELLSGYIKMDSDHLRDISWINPILLESCIQSKNEEIRFSVQKLVKRTSSTQGYPPSPQKKSQSADANTTQRLDSGSMPAPPVEECGPSPDGGNHSLTDESTPVESGSVAIAPQGSGKASNFEIVD